MPPDTSKDQARDAKETIAEFLQSLALEELELERERDLGREVPPVIDK